MKKKWKLGLLFCVTLPDQTEADLINQGASYDAQGNLTITAQKVLKDKTTNESVNDGPPIQLSAPAGDPNATAVGASLDTAMLNLYQAQQNAAASATASTDPAKS